MANNDDVLNIDNIIARLLEGKVSYISNHYYRIYDLNSSRKIFNKNISSKL